MRLLYLLIILFIVHCSNNVQLNAQSAEDRFANSLLGSELAESTVLKCDTEEECTITETFLMNESETAVDVVFVLDVSSSMKDNLKKLGSSMLNLLDHIHEFDWQMAFTTADHGDHYESGGKITSEKRWESHKGDQPHFGQFMNLEYRNSLLEDKILNKHKYNNYETVFYDTLTINKQNPCSLPPFCQKDHEQPLRALKAAIERPENRDFFRPNSDLIAIIITNEDERGADPDNATTAEEVVRTFQSQFSGEKSLYGFGILIEDQDKRCRKIQRSLFGTKRAEYGKRIAELARITHGSNIDICSDNYGNALEKISRVIRDRVLDNVYLTTAFPNASSVDVQINPVQNIEWKVEGRHIVFKPALKLGSEVQVTYTPR